jgi:hypothetical protein
MAPQAVVREPSHAGSWYSASKTQLSSELDGWLDAVQPPVKCIGSRSEGQTIGSLPVEGARVIIAPYANRVDILPLLNLTNVKYADMLGTHIQDPPQHGRTRHGM